MKEKWTLLAPYFDESYVKDKRWLAEHVTDDSYEFELITRPHPITKWHDRKEAFTPAIEWIRHWQHGVLAMRSDSVGVVTAFPQLPLVLGIYKRLRRSSKPIIAWTFNVGVFRDSGLRGVLARFGLHAVDKFVVHTRDEIALYSEHFRIPEDRFVFVPFTSSKIEQQATEREEGPFITALGSAHRDFPTLFSVVEELGIETVVAASRNALEGIDIPDVVSTPFDVTRDDCRRFAQEARLNVVPLQPKDDVSAAGYVTVIEALMMGRVLIVTDAYGMGDYVTHGETGWLVPPNDPEAMREAIETLWNDHELRERIGRQAQAMAFEQLEHSSISEHLTRLLREVRRLDERVPISDTA